MAITKIGTPELFDFSATNTALQLPTGPTSGTGGRPSNPSTGEWRFNTTEKYVEFWDGGAWRQIDTEAPATPDDFPSQNFNVNTYFGTDVSHKIDAKFNEAANFNGSSSYIEISQTLLGSGTLKTWSTSFWFKTSSATEQYLNNTAAAGANSGYSVYIKNSGYLIFTTSSGGGGTSEKGLEYQTDLSDGNWHNVVATYTSSGGTNDATLKLYVDGADVTSSSVAVNGYVAGSGSTYNSFTVPRIVLGRWADIGSAVAILEGAIDQVRFFNTTLTDAQAIDCYTDETTTTAATLNFPAGAGCIAAYQLDGDASDVGGTYGGVTTDIGYTGLRFQPDFVWIKRRVSGSESHALYDSIRGINEQLSSDTNADEATNTAPFEGFTSFDANGFTVDNNGATNRDPNSYVAWCFKGGGAPTATNSNTSGSMTADSVSIDGTLQAAYTPSSTIYPKKISINTENGLSIVQYQGTGSTATVEHGLGLVPKLILTKVTSVSGNSWACYTEATGIDKYLELNQTSSAGSYTGYWGSSLPTTSVFGVVNGNYNNNYSGQNIIAYSFADIANYQKIGSYTGNNGTNTISTEITSGDGGFEPAFLLIKNTAAASTNNWIMVDNKRSPANQRKQVLNANLADAESTETVNINFLTNGFQLTNGNSAVNDGSGTYIYLAIAADKDSSVPTQANSFSPTLYTGTSAAQNIATPFAPDFTWIKSRSIASSNGLYDTIRGGAKWITSNGTNSNTDTPTALQKFNPNGFTLGDDSGAWGVNASGATYVSWNWKAGGLPTINSDGTNITSIVSANQAAGFSIVKYTGIGSTASVGHGLGVAPTLILAKCLDITSAWVVYSETTGINKFIELNDSATPYTASGYWGSSAPTTSVFEVKDGNVNNNSTGNSIIAYCFADIANYQKVGSYTWTGTSYTAGTLVTGLGFTPRFVMIKGTDVASNWMLYDNQRGSGTQKYRLAANIADAEDQVGYQGIIFDSDGFSAGAGADGNVTGSDGLNKNGSTYIYLAVK
jgi:hypothetical protein